MTGASLRANRDYQLLWSASTISELGSSITILAFPLLVLGLGGNAAQAGAVATCALLTELVLKLPGGHLADRLDRRWIMVGCDVVRLTAIASIPIAYAADALTFVHLLVVAVVSGAAGAFFGGAAPVALRDIVPNELLVNAFSLNQARIAAVGLGGPALGGALFGLDPMLPFIVDAASYAVSSVLLLLIRSRPRTRTATRTDDRRITAGMRWIAGQGEIVRILAFVSVLNLVGAAAQVALVISLRADGTSPATIGLIMTGAGVGALIGSLLAPRIIRWLPTPVLLAVVALVWVGGLSSFAITSAPWVVGPALVLMILLTPACGIKLSEITVGRAPRDVLGRVNAAEGTVSHALAAPGPLLAGIAIAAIGSDSTWYAMAGVCFVTAAAVLVVALVRPAPPVPAPADGAAPAADIEPRASGRP